MGRKALNLEIIKVKKLICTFAVEGFVFEQNSVYEGSDDLQYVSTDLGVPWALNEDIKVRENYYEIESTVLATFKEV